MNRTESGLIAIGAPGSTMRILTEKKYVFHEDAGHGWLQVPVSQLSILGIANKVTGYSYQNLDTAYLEEDLDYTIFTNAWEAKTGIKWNHAEMTETKYQENSRVRNYRHYSSN